LSDQGTVEAIGWRHHYPKRLYPGTATSVPRRQGSIDFRLSWFNPLSWFSAGWSARRSTRLIFAWVTPVDAIPYWVISIVAGVPTTAIVHNIEPHERLPMSRSLTALFLRRLDRAVAHSDTVREGILDIRPDLDVEVVPHPPNIEVDPTDHPTPTTPFRLVQPGFVRTYKGADLAIDALAEVRARGLDANLTIVGEFWDVDPDALRLRAHGLGLDDHVTVIDRYVGDEDLIGQIAESHAVVLPYRSATQSGLIPLALAAGRPVVTTDVGGLAEQVENGVNAVVAPRAIAGDLADGIERVHADYDLYVSAAQRYDVGWSAVADALGA
jgi:glycosyltransferase involved in cell wall biosynthesis